MDSRRKDNYKLMLFFLIKVGNIFNKMLKIGIYEGLKCFYESLM